MRSSLSFLFALWALLSAVSLAVPIVQPSYELSYSSRPHHDGASLLVRRDTGVEDNLVARSLSDLESRSVEQELQARSVLEGTVDATSLERRGFWGSIKNRFKKIGSGIKNAVHRVAKGVRNTVNRVAKGVRHVANGIKNGIRKVGNAVKHVANKVKQVAGKIKNGVVKAANWVKKNAKTFGKVYLKAIATAASIASRIPIPVVKNAAKWVGKAADYASNLIPGQIGGALGKAMNVMDVVQNPYGSALKAVTKGSKVGGMAAGLLDNIFIKRGEDGELLIARSLLDGEHDLVERDFLEYNEHLLARELAERSLDWEDLEVRDFDDME